MESLERHGELVRGCVRCFPEGGNAPVVDEVKDVRVLLVGQAPGVSEAETRLPFTGPAGRRGAAGTRVPSRAMISNCREHLLREFELLRPQIVIPVGRLAIKELLGIGRLSEAVGETFRRDEVVYVPLPHPSGASTWLNVPENRGRLLRALAVLGELVAAGRIGGS